MKTLSRIYMALIFAFLYAPLAVILLFSFNSGNSTAIFSGFSLHWYKELINDGVTINAFGNTLILALTSAAIATVFGTAAAVGIFNIRSKRIKGLVMGVTNVPMMNPDIVTGVSMMLLFVFIGRAIGAKSSLNFFTLLIAHVTFNLPYVILNVLPKLRQTDPHLAEAAEDLGCTPVKAFFKVVMPSISSGILSGFVMSFTLSLDDFVISYFTSGASFQTLPIRIYAMTKKRVTPDMYALSSIIFAAVLILLVVMNIVKSKAESREKGAVER